MKSLTTIVLGLLAFSFAQAQQEDFNRFSVELQGGLHMPLMLTDNIVAADYTDFRSGTAGVRYMFTECFGLRFNYGYHSFLNQEDDTQGVDYQRLTLSGVWNFQLGNRFGVLGHAGLGYALADPSETESTEQTAVFLLGLSPQVKLSNRLALYLDATYLVSASQHYFFDGSVAAPNFQSRTAGFATFSIGLNIYVGKETHHADWSKRNSDE